MTFFVQMKLIIHNFHRIFIKERFVKVVQNASNSFLRFYSFFPCFIRRDTLEYLPPLKLCELVMQTDERTLWFHHCQRQLNMCSLEYLKLFEISALLIENHTIRYRYHLNLENNVDTFPGFTYLFLRKRFRYHPR